MIFSDPVCDDAPSQVHSTERECESCKFLQIPRIHRIFTNFKNSNEFLK